MKAITYSGRHNYIFDIQIKKCFYNFYQIVKMLVNKKECKVKCYSKNINSVLRERENTKNVGGKEIMKFCLK